MRIRYPFAGAFTILILISAYIGLLPHNVSDPSSPGSSIPANLQPNDKLLHLVTFFFLSLAFYWIPDTSRRRAMNLTLISCTVSLGVGSEIVQHFLNNGRSFDIFDIIANIVGSLGAVGLCSWYHRRMLERRRKARFGTLVDGAATDDVELGVNPSSSSGLGAQESGTTTLEQEVDNWDENAVDNWEDGDDADGDGNGPKTPGSSSADGDLGDGKK
ncbi:hypothetical protein FQN54_007234 [Arachnomyces sp. PD_36]|nr:hypothetical protein FQN54_007234 [Arachnomyces sp. PD_36]